MRFHHFVSLVVLSAIIFAGVLTQAAGPTETQRQVSAALWGTGPMGPFMPGANSSTVAIGPNAGIQTEFQRHISATLWGTGPAGPFPSSTTGTLVLMGTNTYTGATTISSGTLRVGSTTTTTSLSSGNLTINSNNLNVGSSVTLRGSGPYTAGTTVTNGILSVAGNSYTGSTTASNGAVYIGSGTINTQPYYQGSLTLNGAANLNLSGTLANVVLSNGSANNSSIATGTGTLVVGAVSNFNITNGSGVAPITISSQGGLTKVGVGTLLLNSGTYLGQNTIISGNSATVNFDASGNVGSIVSDAIEWGNPTTQALDGIQTLIEPIYPSTELQIGDIDQTNVSNVADISTLMAACSTSISAVPEPSAIVLAVLALSALLLARRFCV